VKKILFLLLICFSIIQPNFASDDFIVSNTTLGMAKAGLADSTSFTNPANVASREENAPSIITNFSLIEELALNQISSPLGYFQYPKMSMGASVYSNNLALSINIDSYLEDREYNGELLSYTGYNRFSLIFDWGYRINDINVGMRLQGGSISKRSNFELRDNYLLLLDYIVNSFFSSYTSVPNSDFFSLGFSIKYNFLDNLSFAYMIESDVDLNIDSSQKDLISYLKDSSFGFTYTSDKYSEFNQLNTFVYINSIDIAYIANPLKRELRIGGKVKLQLGNYNSISLRAGYYERKPTISDLFEIDTNLGISTFALAYENIDLSIVANVSIPINSYFDLNNGITFGINGMFKF